MQALLGTDEPEAAAVVNPGGASPFLLIGDHAGRRVPRALADLGLSEAELALHIGWDIGIGALGEALAGALDAVFVHQLYSRLVIDCNRDPAARDAIPAISDGTIIPGNAGLAPDAVATRVGLIHAPYHAAIAAEIARRDVAARPTVVVALHSFTPTMNGLARPWHCGILHNGANDALSRAMLARLEGEAGLVVGDNAPYAMDGIDYTVPRHAFSSRRLYVEIEVRQDLLDTPPGVDDWVRRLARLLPLALTDTDRD